MKALAYIVAIALIAVPAWAEDTLMDGGRSPNEKYEVRIGRETGQEPSDYGVHIYGITAKPLFTLVGNGGYLDYLGAVERCRALWHSSSGFVAITDQGTRHSRELYVVAVYPTRAERIEVPDYVQNALGRIDATSVDFACVSSPKRWNHDDLVVDLYFTANHRHSYTCEVVLHLSHDEHSAPAIKLKSVSKPKEGAG